MKCFARYYKMESETTMYYKMEHPNLPFILLSYLSLHEVIQLKENEFYFNLIRIHDALWRRKEEFEMYLLTDRDNFFDTLYALLCFGTPVMYFRERVKNMTPTQYEEFCQVIRH